MSIYDIIFILLVVEGILLSMILLPFPLFFRVALINLVGKSGAKYIVGIGLLAFYAFSLYGDFASRQEHVLRYSGSNHSAIDLEIGKGKMWRDERNIYMT